MMRFAYLEVINLSGRVFFVLFAKLGHQTMTFVANEQRFRKHMNTTTTKKDSVVFYEAPSQNMTYLAFLFDCNCRRPCHHRVFSRFLLLTLGPFIREKTRRALPKTRTTRINGTKQAFASYFRRDLHTRLILEQNFWLFLFCPRLK